MALELHGLVDDVFGWYCDGDAGGFEDGLAHVDADLLDIVVVVDDEAEVEDSSCGFDFEGGLAGGLAGDGEVLSGLCEFVLIGVFCVAADAVTAHFGF